MSQQYIDMAEISSGSPAASKHRRILLWVIVTVLAVLAVAGTAIGKYIYDDYQNKREMAAVLDTDTFYPGIAVQGIDLGGKTMEQARAEVKALEPSLRGTYDITVRYKDKTWKLTQDDLSFTFNTDSVLKEAYSYGRSGTRADRYKTVKALETAPKKYEITNTMSYDGIDAKLKEMVKGIAYAPVDATVASFDPATATFRYADGKDGLSVDENKLYAEVEAIINGPKTGTVEVPTKVIPFNKTVAEVKSHLQKLGTYSTVSTNTANGTYNMSRALRSVNGTKVAPGAVFSFNKVVGNCNAANGYKPAGAIVGGKLTQEYGGGICQASTTLYGAALRSNMQIVQRSNHTIQSSYCPIGQDATVSYPYLDFKFKNPTEYPIYIVTSVSGRKLTATFYGYQSPDYDSIQITSRKTQTIPAPSTPKYTVDKTLKAGQKRLEAKAHAGARAVAQRVFYKSGKAVKTESLPSSYYPPRPAYYSIGPSTSAAKSSSKAASKSPDSSPSSSSAAPNQADNGATEDNAPD